MNLAIDYYYLEDKDGNEYGHSGTYQFLVNKILQSEYDERQWCVKLDGEIVAKSRNFDFVKRQLDRIWEGKA